MRSGKIDKKEIQQKMKHAKGGGVHGNPSHEELVIQKKTVGFINLKKHYVLNQHVIPG